jgi:hypothetical protein
MGNGYIRVKKEVGSNKDIVVQCTMCESQGELDEEGNILRFDTTTNNRLQ